MQSSTRWALVVLVIVVIGILLFFWRRGDQPQAPARGEIAMQPAAPKPEPKAELKPEPSPAPVKPKADEPLTATVLFDYKRSELRSGEAPKLDELTAKLKGRAFDSLGAIGHADRIGSVKYNLLLSKRRAEAVRTYLVGKGVDAKRIRTEAKGEGEPVTDDACKNMGPENRKNQKLIECLQRDRRVEIELVVTP